MAKFLVRWRSGEGEYEALSEKEAIEYAQDDMTITAVVIETEDPKHIEEEDDAKVQSDG
jgi:hypothetical protein